MATTISRDGQVLETSAGIVPAIQTPFGVS